MACSNHIYAERSVDLRALREPPIIYTVTLIDREQHVLGSRRSGSTASSDIPIEIAPAARDLERIEHALRTS